MIHSAPRVNSTILAGALAESRLVLEVVQGLAVHLRRARVDVALRIEPQVEVAARGPPVDEFERRELDDAMAELRVEARGFRVDDELAHSGIRVKV